MNDVFEKRVRAAAVAAWWAVLVAVAFVVLQWLVYLAVIHARPAWILSMWGPNLDWAFVQAVWFWGVAVLKFVVWLMAHRRPLADPVGEAIAKPNRRTMRQAIPAVQLRRRGVQFAQGVLGRRHLVARLASVAGKARLQRLVVRNAPAKRPRAPSTGGEHPSCRRQNVLA